MAEAVRPKRREILVDQELQVGLAMSVLGWLYFYLVIFAVLANAPAIWTMMTTGAEDDAYFEAVQRLHWFLRYSIVPLAVTFVCIGAHCLAFTHRIAGPVYRFKATLREMAAGRLPKSAVQLRRKDFLTSLAEEFNATIDTRREHAERAIAMNGETAEAVKSLVGAIESGRDQAHVLALAHVALDRAEHLGRHLRPAEAGEAAAPRDEEKTAVTAAAVTAANS